MYEPQVDDYVRWTTALGMVHEGWVYFKCDPTPKREVGQNQSITLPLSWV